MNLPIHHLGNLRGYKLDDEDVKEIMDIFGPGLAEHGITFRNISRKEENEEVLVERTYVTKYYQIAMMSRGNFEVHIKDLSGAIKCVSYNSDDKTWSAWTLDCLGSPFHRRNSESLTGLWLSTEELKLLYKALEAAGKQELMVNEIIFVD